jgi:MFS transporter, ACS family, tartrate transporter
VSFAALTMNQNLGLSATAYGLGVGIFFFSCFVFEVLSNLALERFGARKWIDRIIFTLGSGLLRHGVRAGRDALLRRAGAARRGGGGFFPGIIFYRCGSPRLPGADHRLVRGGDPALHRVRAPVSSALTGARRLRRAEGLAVAVMLEAVPALILAVVTWFHLTDRPAAATWLQAGERDWLTQRLAEEQRQQCPEGLIDTKVLALLVVYFGGVATNYGTAYFLPQIVKAFGLSNVQTGFVCAIPYVVGSIGMVWFGHRSDRHMERKGHAAVAFALAAIGIGLSPLFDDPPMKMLCLSIGAFGVFAVLPEFWILPRRSFPAHRLRRGSR